jgi:chromosome segregation ATPase
MDATIQAVLISAVVGLLTLLVNALLNRRRARVEDAGLAEDTQGKEIGNLQVIIDEWREHYGALNERTRVTENELKALRAENAALREQLREMEDGAREMYNRLRQQVEEEKAQRVAQSDLIIKLTAEVLRLNNEIIRLSGIVESQATTISKLRADLTQSEKLRVELQTDLTRAEGEIHLLRAQLDIVRQGQSACGL